MIQLQIMPAPLGEGNQSDLDFDALLQTPTPTFELIEPKTAPADLLSGVRVNTEGRCLEAKTPVGIIAVEMYWKTGDGPEEEESRGDFFAALSPDQDAAAETNPTATQRNSYTILPDGALYEVVVRAPLKAANADWSPERVASVGRAFKLFGGVSLAEFRLAYPGVEIDLPEGQYKITATERTKPALAIAARVENGEPLMRLQEASGKAVHYRETLAGDFMRSGLRPDTAVAVVDSRTTIRSGGEAADRQRLEFKAHDGFQRTGNGAEENSGVVELIIMQGEAVESTGFTFTPYQPPALPRSTYDSYRLGFGDSFATKDLTDPGNSLRGFSGLTGGETRYRPPETIDVSFTSIRNLRAIAAFRFAMAGAHELPTNDET